MTLSLIENTLDNNTDLKHLVNPLLTQKDLNVLSLFSGCGGMDLGFEGGFQVLTDSINKDINPRWITIEIDENWSILKPTRFKTVFANDIREDAQLAWQTYFGNRNISPDIYHLESI